MRHALKFQLRDAVLRAANARADEAWARFLRTGFGRPAEDVVADLKTRLEARRKELQGKHRPTATG